jgi:hypothetical protein
MIITEFVVVLCGLVCLCRGHWIMGLLLLVHSCNRP